MLCGHSALPCAFSFPGTANPAQIQFSVALGNIMSFDSSYASQESAFEDEVEGDVAGCDGLHLSAPPGLSARLHAAYHAQTGNQHGGLIAVERLGRLAVAFNFRYLCGVSSRSLSFFSVSSTACNRAASTLFGRATQAQWYQVQYYSIPQADALL